MSRFIDASQSDILTMRGWTVDATLVGDEIMAKKKSEERRHTAMMRIDSETLDKAKLAASLMKMSLADYSSDVLRKAAERDISREAKKLVGGG
jgi:predicted HicB family RNase H-like nuclease